MNASQIAHRLKEYGNGDEWQGVVNVYTAGKVVGGVRVAVLFAAGYVLCRFGKWGMDRCYQEMERRTEGKKTTGVCPEARRICIVP